MINVDEIIANSTVNTFDHFNEKPSLDQVDVPSSTSTSTSRYIYLKECSDSLPTRSDERGSR